MLTFLQLAEKTMGEEKRPLDGQEIGEIALKKGYNNQVSSKGKTPWFSMGAQIYVNIRDDISSPFVKISTRPTKFYLKSLLPEGTKELEKLKEENPEIPVPYKEKDLHQVLTYYFSTFRGVLTKTLVQRKSLKKGYAEWTHPDLVGVYIPIGIWSDEVLEIARIAGSNIVFLYSFEIKIELSFSNIREAFFQTVSNSSWANEAYLCAAKISRDEDFQDELKRLSNSFEIGIIRLDIEDPDATEILFPAKPKPELEIDTVNKLCQDNPGFKKFLDGINKDISSREVRKERYDNVEKLESIINFFIDLNKIIGA